MRTQFCCDNHSACLKIVLGCLKLLKYYELMFSRLEVPKHIYISKQANAADNCKVHKDHCFLLSVYSFVS